MKKAIISLYLLSFFWPAAAQMYWDSNGAADGAGGATPAGTWGTDLFWSTFSAGDIATSPWVDGSTAVFAAGTDATGTYTITVNDTQSVGGLTFEEGTVTLSGGTLSFPGSANIQVDTPLATINSVLTGGTGPLNQLGSGTLVLGGVNTFSNTYSLAQGTLRMGASGDILPNATVAVSAFATLDLNNFNVGIGSLGVASFSANSSVNLGSGTLTNLGTVPNSRYDGVISGTGNLVKIGTNTLTLAGVNTFTGRTMILGGVLSLASISPNDALGTLPESYVPDQLIIDGGVLNFPNTSPTNILATRGIYLGPNGGTITMASSKAPNIYPNITGPGALLKSSTGNMTLSGINTFAGDLTMLAGGVRFNSDCAAGTGTVVVNPNLGTGVFLRNLLPPGNFTTLTNPIVVYAGTGIADLNAALPDTFVLSGPISGTGPLVRGQQVGSSGYLVLSGDSSGWSGGLAMFRGKLALGHKNALGTGAFTLRPTVNTGATAAANIATLYAWTPLTGANAVATPMNIDITNAAAHFAIDGTNTLEFSGPISLGTVTPAITNNNSGGTIFSGPVTGGPGVGLIKEGIGTHTLSGANTYSGVTTINAGNLLVNAPGSLAGGGVTVNAAGTLEGSGTISGLVTANGGTVSAGAGIGTLTLAGGLNLNGGGTNVWELTANSTSSPGVDFDQIVLTGGALTLGGSSTLKIVFAGTASAPDSSNPFWQSPRSWTIISATGAASNFGAIENGTYPAGNFTTSVTAGGIVLTFTPNAASTPVSSFSISAGPGTDLTVNYSGGSGLQFVLLRTNNVAAPMSAWTRLQTNAASPGSFVITPGSDPQQFYRIKVE